MPHCSFGQVQQVWLHGRVVRQSDSLNIPLAQIASYKNMNVYAADSLGEFRVIISNNDSLKVFALGFEPQVFRIDTLQIDADEVYYFPLSQISYQIQQVDIHNNIFFNNYMDKLRAMRRKQMEMNLNLPSDIKLGQEREMPADRQPLFKDGPGVIGSILSPASALYYATSKSEKQKRNLVKIIEDEGNRQLLTVELMTEISGLSGDELNAFIVFCNANIKISSNDDSLSIKYKVIDLFEEYKQALLTN